MEGSINDLEILTGKLTGNWHLGRPKRRWGDDTRIDLNDVSGRT